MKSALAVETEEVPFLLRTLRFRITVKGIDSLHGRQGQASRLGRLLSMSAG